MRASFGIAAETNPTFPFSSLTSTSSAFSPYALSATYSSIFPSSPARAIVTWTPRTSLGQATRPIDSLTRGGASLIAGVADGASCFLPPIVVAPRAEPRAEREQDRHRGEAPAPPPDDRLAAPLPEPVVRVESRMDVRYPASP